MTSSDATEWPELLNAQCAENRDTLHLWTLLVV
jgi:hypothetical protein